MNLSIPHPLKAEHEILHARIDEAVRETGAVGEAAREVARLLAAHFVREEEFALPPLALLERVAREGIRADMAAVLPLTRRLKAELPGMLEEHRAIVAALGRLVTAAREEKMPKYERFASALILHAQMEEQVLYPAAIVFGDAIERALGTAALLQGGFDEDFVQ